MVAGELGLWWQGWGGGQMRPMGSRYAQEAEVFFMAAAGTCLSIVRKPLEKERHSQITSHNAARSLAQLQHAQAMCCREL
jgi:hypothetical protein